MRGPGMSHTVAVTMSSNFSQLLLYHTPHSPLSLILLLAAHPAHHIRVQFMGYQRNLRHGPHSSPLDVTFYTTAGGHTPC